MDLGSMDHLYGSGPWTPGNEPDPWTLFLKRCRKEK